ncbi:MAG: hypothetical protein HRT66_08760 [Flavobacteriaceae bacterium]|nr:hypothetical protein [Flavobacteriaceae bacterium]
MVSVNGSAIPKERDAEEYLNRVYGKAGVKFSVDTDKIKIGQKTLEIGDSKMLL